MGIPTDIGIVDTMIGFPHRDMKETYRFITNQTKDRQSKDDFEFPVEYMFKDVPEKKLARQRRPGRDDAVGDGPMGRGTRPHRRRTRRRHRRPRPEVASRPLHPVGVVRSQSGDGRHPRASCTRYETWGIRAVGVFPAGTFPQVAINDKKMYPLYAKCVELGIPVFCCAGIPGPRLKFAVQHVELIDEVMYDFPELTFVTRHGCEPWADLIVKLMLKWPGLHYSTSAFAPRYYPQAIVNYANTRGADKVIYAGYFPMGLSLERIMTEMPGVGFKDDVWPKFLRSNALRVLGLDK